MAPEEDKFFSTNVYLYEHTYMHMHTEFFFLVLEIESRVLFISGKDCIKLHT